MSGTRARWDAPTAEDMERIGGRLARALPRPLPTAAIAHLAGDLGAGKTTLVRGLLRAAGVTGPVRSPTYTLLETYEAGGLVMVHLDLYRLRDPSELEALGLRDFALPEHLWLVEWPERGAERLPAADLVLALSAGEREHRVEATARSALGEAWIAAAS